MCPLPDASINNRRPLKTRGWVFFQRLAKRLADAGVTPNAISLSSILFACLAGAAFAATGLVENSLAQKTLWITAAMCIQLRLIANLLDGMVAIEGGKRSPVGELYNEVPDRVADAAIFLGAGWVPGSAPWMGALATIVAIFVAYVRAMGVAVGVGQTFHGPMAKPHRMALLTATAVAAALIPTDWLIYRQLMPFALGLVIVGGGVTAWRRLAVIAQRMREAAA